MERAQALQAPCFGVQIVVGVLRPWGSGATQPLGAPDQFRWVLHSLEALVRANLTHCRADRDAPSYCWVQARCEPHHTQHTHVNTPQNILQGALESI